MKSIATIRSSSIFDERGARADAEAVEDVLIDGKEEDRRER